MKVIIGAGLTGLSTAYHLQSDDYVILEKSDDVGGACGSYSQDGFTFDYAGHVMHFRQSHTEQFVKRLLDGNYHTLLRRACICCEGRLVPYPFQMNLALLPHRVKKECIMGAIKATYETDDKDRKPANFAEWILYSLGEGIAKYFMFPYNEKLWTVSPDEMTTDWMRGFVPRPDLSDIVEGALRSRHDNGIGYNARFGYPLQGGILAYPRELAVHVKNLHLNIQVDQVDLKARTVRANGTTYPFSTLISTMPLVGLVRRIKDVPTRVQQAADKLKYNSVCSVFLGINRPDVADQHWIYIPQKDLIFYRVGFPGNLSPYMCPKGTSSICAEVAFRGELGMSKDEVIDEVIHGLRSIGLLKDNDEILVRNAVVTYHAYVIFDKHHTTSTKLIHDYLQQQGIISMGRYGGWEYSGMEEALILGRRTAERVQQAEGFEQAFVTQRPVLSAEETVDFEEAFEEAFPPPPVEKEPEN